MMKVSEYTNSNDHDEHYTSYAMCAIYLIDKRSFNPIKSQLRVKKDIHSYGSVQTYLAPV